ncbi:unnamed protein product [Symbiodinium pilosum]|uniref:Uncharacterized protein n=1 Tax=Symbiodinium pilosum TaxID=2952 RepID=A0A812UHL7_SYMPI|nr:unnamed protein product [Symbiodinium pilosum]
MPEYWSAKLSNQGLLFEAPEPNGRGIFVSHREDFVLRLNRSDHLQLLMPWNSAEVDSVSQSLTQQLGLDTGATQVSQH